MTHVTGTATFMPSHVTSPVGQGLGPILTSCTCGVDNPLTMGLSIAYRFPGKRPGKRRSV